MAESIASQRRVSMTGSITWNSKKQGVDQADFVCIDILNFYLDLRYDIIHFLRREMLDFTAFPVFFVSNLLLVQCKKYYFNRATVSRNCSIVL